MAGEDAVEGAPFGRYRLLRLLGRGGMGEVWRAHDTETDRIVAIKLLPPHLSDDGEFQSRFRREAHAAARLNDPHVIPIHGYGEIDGRLYVDMRLIEGNDLATVLADGPLDPLRAVRIIEQVATALHAAHEVGLLHRDIKPSNILVGRNDFAYLIDFGIARAADETRMTKSGFMVGTFQYIAPERLDSQIQEDARADIYSLACVFYEALTGEPPFSSTTAAHLIAAHLNTPPPRPSTTQPNVSPAVDRVIATGMAKDPDQRYATTIELADAARDAITTPLAPPSEPALLADSTRPASARPQQAAEQTQHAPKPIGQQPPDRSSAPRGNRNQWLVLGVVAALIVVSAVVGAGIYIATKISNKPAATSSSTPSASTAPATTTPASTAPATTTPAGPPVGEAALGGLLLSLEQVNTAMGATNMEDATTGSTNLAHTHDEVQPPECLVIDAAAQDTVYAGSGYTASRLQVLKNSDNSHVALQAVVLFPTSEQAAAFYATSTQQWSACHSQYTTHNSAVWSAGPISDVNRTLSVNMVSSQFGTCERALMFSNNVVVDVMACRANIADPAINIAHQIAAKVPA